jgi:hypothetical protein
VSNALAIATVTATLTDLLLAPAQTINGSAKVNTGWPDPGVWTGSVGVNLFLYEIAPNAALANDDLPTRRPSGEAVCRPQAALELGYLLSFYGDEGQLEAQRILGKVVSFLHAYPVLDRAAITAAITARSTGIDNYLAGSNLDQQIESVRFVPRHVSIEELSRLWATFPQSAYAVSLAYHGSVVLIEEDLAVEPVLPVQDRGVRGMPFRQPVVDRVVAASGHDDPILPTSMLLVIGERLAGIDTRIRIDDVELVPASEAETQLSLPVPAALSAGLHRLQVVQRVPLGKPEVPHTGVESNVAPFVLRPLAEHFATTGIGAARVVTVDVTPAVAVGQRASLLLNEQPGGGAAAYRFDRPPESAPVSQLSFTVGDVTKGDYVVSVQVDGAQSPITWQETPPPPMFTPELKIW